MAETQSGCHDTLITSSYELAQTPSQGLGKRKTDRSAPSAWRVRDVARNHGRVKLSNFSLANLELKLEVLNDPSPQLSHGHSSLHVKSQEFPPARYLKRDQKYPNGKQDQASGMLDFSLRRSTIRKSLVAVFVFRRRNSFYSSHKIPESGVVQQRGGCSVSLLSNSPNTGSRLNFASVSRTNIAPVPTRNVFHQTKGSSSY